MHMEDAEDMEDARLDAEAAAPAQTAQPAQPAQQPKLKVFLFVLCHDDASEACARQDWDVPWARVVRLENTLPMSVFREGAAFLGAIKDSEAEWRDADFVGSVSWKARQKIGLRPEHVLEACLAASGGAADVVALYPYGRNLLEHTAACLPRFQDAWVRCLGAVGHDAADTAGPKAHDMPYFVCNYWLASPAWMASYIAWLERLAHAMLTTPEVQDVLWADTRYATGLEPSRLLELYGRPYLPHHGFITERTPCFFFWHNGARIHMNRR